MIQRIQSVFLLLAAVSAVLLFFFPLASYFGDFHSVEVFVYYVKDFVPSGEPLFGPYFLLPLTIIAALLVIMPFSTIFLYKKMRQQIKVIQFTVILDLLFVGLVFLFFTDAFAKATQSSAEYQIGVFLPLIHIVLTLLALRAINKDIKLIRSADRLR